MGHIPRTGGGRGRIAKAVGGESVSFQILLLDEEFPRRKTQWLSWGKNAVGGWALWARSVKCVFPFNSQNSSLGAWQYFHRFTGDKAKVQELPDHEVTKESAPRRPNLEANSAFLIASPGSCYAGTGAPPDALWLPSFSLLPSLHPTIPSFSVEDKTITS